jgi:hypothetical protein
MIVHTIAAQSFWSETTVAEREERQLIQSR